MGCDSIYRCSQCRREFRTGPGSLFYYQGFTATCPNASTLVEVPTYTPEAHAGHSLVLSSRRVLTGRSRIWPPPSLRGVNDPRLEQTLQVANGLGLRIAARIGLQDSELLQEMAACERCERSWSCLACGAETHERVSDPPPCSYCSFEDPGAPPMTKVASGSYWCQACGLEAQVPSSVRSAHWELALVRCPERGMYRAIRPRGLWYHLAHSDLVQRVAPSWAEPCEPQTAADALEAPDSPLPPELRTDLAGTGISVHEYLAEMRACPTCRVGTCPRCGQTDHPRWVEPGPCPACGEVLPAPIATKFVD